MKFCGFREYEPMSDPQKEIRSWLQQELASRPHGTKGALAKFLGVRADAITRMANMDPNKETREIRAHELELMRQFFRAETSDRNEDGAHGQIKEFSRVPIDEGLGDDFSVGDAQGYSREHWKPKFPGALPELDISAGAGEGTVGNVIALRLDGGAISAHEVVDEWPLPMSWLHEAVNDVSQSLVVKIIGESMVPNYLPGDRVIVDLSQDQFMTDSVYLISDGEGAPQIKRLQRVPLSVPTRVTIISDNPAYENHEVEVDLLRIHGRVCAYVGRR